MKRLLDMEAQYRSCRSGFLREVEKVRSGSRGGVSDWHTYQGDPIPEFCEALVCAVVGGRRAPKNQSGWDVLGHDRKTRIQVRSLRNANRQLWINEHTIEFADGVDRYALVIFGSMRPELILTFTRASLAPAYAALRKRHQGDGVKLQLTRRNVQQILRDKPSFESIGVTAIALPRGRQRAAHQF